MLDLATVLTTIFTHIDDFCKRSTRLKCGAKPVVLDSEIITIMLVSELLGLRSEYEQVAFTKQWLKEYFPRMIDRSQYHRRIKSLMQLVNDVRIHILHLIPLADAHIIDSTPIPVITFNRAHFTPLFPEASFGRCAARKMTYYGFKLHLVTDTQGIPIHFDLTPAKIADISMTEELLSASSINTLTFADKGYLSDPLETRLFEGYNITLISPKRKNMKNRESVTDRRILNKIRQRIEVTNGLLKEQFRLERTYAKTLYGLMRRIVSKITAMTVAIFFNHLFGRPLMHISTLI